MPTALQVLQGLRLAAKTYNVELPECGEFEIMEAHLLWTVRHGKPNTTAFDVRIADASNKPFDPYEVRARIDVDGWPRKWLNARRVATGHYEADVPEGLEGRLTWNIRETEGTTQPLFVLAEVLEDVNLANRTSAWDYVLRG